MILGKIPINNIKHFLFYLVYVIPLLCLASWADVYPGHLKLHIKSQGDSYMWGLVIFIAVVPLCIGLMFGLPRFVALVKREGTWQFDWVKFLGVGIPTLYGALFPAVFWSGLAIRLPYNALIMPYPLSGIIFGYIILASLDKDIEDKF